MIDYINAITLLANYIIVPSLAYGSQLALGALGITMVYAVLRFSNFAHGEIMSFGTMISIFIIWLFQSIGISINPLPTALLALPFSITATIILLLILDKTVFRYYQQQRVQPVTFMIVSVGVMFFLAGFIRFLIGTSKKNFDDGERFIVKASQFKQMTGLAEGLSIRTTQAITVIVTILLVIFIFWFLIKTRTGKSIRAFSEAFITFAYKRFLTYLLPKEWAPEGLVQILSTEYKFAISFVLLVIVLLVRPTGLFRGKTL